MMTECPGRTHRTLVLPGALLLALSLGACATSNPYNTDGDSDQNATVQGTSDLEHFIPFMDSGVTIRAVDSMPLAADESKVVLPPGSHSFVVDCRVQGQLGEIYTGEQEIKLTLRAGHVYKFVTENPSADSKAERNLSLLHSLTHTKAGDFEQTELESSKQCASFAYDRSYDSNPYPAVVMLVPPLDPGDWKEQKSGKRSGYWWRRLYDSDASEANAQVSMETEYWSKLMYSDDIHARYEERLAKAQKGCRKAQISVIADTPAGLDYELDTPDCDQDSPAELGRFLGDDYGVHRIGIVFRHVPTADEKSAWLKALDGAAIQPL